MDCEKIVPMYDLSVIIPVYNAGRYLNETLRAVVMQTIFDKIELIIVNDGSDDNSMDICEKYADAYSNIVVIDQKNAVSLIQYAMEKGGVAKFAYESEMRKILIELFQIRCYYRNVQVTE